MRELYLRFNNLLTPKVAGTLKFPIECFQVGYHRPRDMYLGTRMLEDNFVGSGIIFL